jgi:hypothetical protein
MKVNEIADLIKIRDYISISINNFSIKRESVNDLNKTLILLDKILVDELTGSAFREKINFQSEANLALQEVIETRKLK